MSIDTVEQTYIILDIDYDTSDVINKNGMRFSKEIVEKMVDDVNNKYIYGSLGQSYDILHPDESKISHQIENLQIVDNELIGTIKVLNTPNGKILSELLKNNVGIEYKVAGTGKFQYNDDGTKVVTNFKLHSINAVPAKYNNKE